MMKTMIKRVCCIFSALAILFSLTSCFLFNYRGYREENKDLYTVAVNNIFAARGYLSNGEVLYDPEIYIVETDEYGRTLFFYSEYFNGTSESQYDYGMAFVIMQKSDDDYAYFYQDKCYSLYFDSTNNWETISENLNNEILEQLKKANDWGLEINTEKCSKAKLTNKKPEGKLHPEDFEFDYIIYPFEVKNGYKGTDRSFCKYSIYCESDSYGKELHYVYGMTMNKTDNGEDVFDTYEYAIILNADGTCSENGIVRISDIKNSMALIEELKQNNNWNIES